MFPDSLLRLGKSKHNMSNNTAGAAVLITLTWNLKRESHVPLARTYIHAVPTSVLGREGGYGPSLGS